jgi:beta-phosphoglucomutase-like phosphatase (HAD superfamily)
MDTLPINGVIFDVDDVLYDATLWRRWLLRLVNQLGVHAEFGEFYGPWDRDYLVDVHCGRREYTEALQSFLLASGLSWAQVDEVEAASRIQRAKLDGSLRPWPGVVKTIAALDDWGLPLVAWFDACQRSTELAQWLERLALASHFRAVLSSFDLECAQPAPRCYQVAVAALGRPAGETLYVGHDAGPGGGIADGRLQLAARRPGRFPSDALRRTAFASLPKFHGSPLHSFAGSTCRRPSPPLGASPRTDGAFPLFRDGSRIAAR